MESGIYCIENLINGKKYIGKGGNVISRMNRSHRGSPYLANAINKYGKDNFKRYIVEYCDSDILSEKEIFYIKKFATKAPNGYNLTDGGEGCFGRICSEETRKKISENHADFSGKNNPLYGKHRSKETKKKISKAHLGKVLSKKHKQKLSKNHANFSKQNNPFYGKSHKETSKEKMRENSIHKKLTGKQILEILNLYYNESYTQEKISKLFPVTRRNIGKITKGETWKPYYNEFMKKQLLK